MDYYDSDRGGRLPMLSGVIWRVWEPRRIHLGNWSACLGRSSPYLLKRSSRRTIAAACLLGSVDIFRIDGVGLLPLGLCVDLEGQDVLSV